MTTGCAVIAGVGPGLGAALARRFAAGGLSVALAARHPERLDTLVAEIESREGAARTVTCDVASERDVAAVFDDSERALGPVRAAIFNAGAFVRGNVVDTDVAEFERCWRVGCLGGFLVGREAARRMLPRSAGSILFTGATAALRGGAGFANLAVPKFGLRALTQSMARELGPQGLHVGHVIVDGQILAPGGGANNEAEDARLTPEAIAEGFWFLHSQPRDAWTQELDLRPWVERF